MRRGKRPQGALSLGEEAHAQQPVGFVQRLAVGRAGAVQGTGLRGRGDARHRRKHRCREPRRCGNRRHARACRPRRALPILRQRTQLLDDASIQRLLRGGRIEGGGFKAVQNRRHGSRLDAERTRRPARRDHQHGCGFAGRRGAAEGAPQRLQRLPALAASRAPRRAADAVQRAGEEDAGRQIETGGRHAAVAASPRLGEGLRRRAQRHVGSEQRGDRRRGLRAAACLRRRHAGRCNHFAGADEPARAHGQRDRLALRAAVFAGLGVEVGERDGRDFARLDAIHAHGGLEALAVRRLVHFAHRIGFGNAEPGCRQRLRAGQGRQAEPRQGAVAAHAHGQFDWVADRDDAARGVHLDGESAADGVHEVVGSTALGQGAHRHPPRIAFGAEDAVVGAAKAPGVAGGAGLQTRHDAHRAELHHAGALQRDLGGEGVARVGLAALAHLGTHHRQRDLAAGGGEAHGLRGRRAGRRRFHVNALDVEQGDDELVALDILRHEPLHRRVEGLAGPHGALRQVHPHQHVVGGRQFADIESDCPGDRLEAGLLDTQRRHGVAAGGRRHHAPLVVERDLLPLRAPPVDDLDVGRDARADAQKRHVAAGDGELRRGGHRLLVEALDLQRERERHVGVDGFRRHGPRRRRRREQRRRGEGQENRRDAGTRSHQSFSTGAGCVALARRRWRCASRSRMACRRFSAWRWDILSSSVPCSRCGVACC